MAAGEIEPGEDAQACLELDEGAVRIDIYFTVLQVDGVTTGYLRLAYGQGSFVNRVLNSVGHRARLVTADGAVRPITLTSSDPTEAPGYLCTFVFRNGGKAHKLGA